MKYLKYAIPVLLFWIVLAFVINWAYRKHTNRNLKSVRFVLQTNGIASINSEPIQVLKTRIDQFGANISDLSFDPTTGKIVMNLTAVQDPERLGRLLQQPGKLEFWDTYENEELFNMLIDVNNELKKTRPEYIAAGTKKDTVESAGDRLFGKLDSSASKKYIPGDDVFNPLFQILYPNVINKGTTTQLGPGPVIGRSFGKDTAQVNRYLRLPEIIKIIPGGVKLLWGANSMSEKQDVFGLYAIKANQLNPGAPLDGSAITDAYQSFDRAGVPEVDFMMNQEGAFIWEKMTGEAVNSEVNGKRVKRAIAIVMDNRVFSAPVVQQKITGGHSEVTGLTDLNEAIDLANVMKSGPLKAEVKVIEEKVQ